MIRNEYITKYEIRKARKKSPEFCAKIDKAEKEAIKRFDEEMYELYNHCKANKEWYMCYLLLVRYHHLHDHNDYEIVCDLINFVDESMYTLNRTEEDNKNSIDLLYFVVDRFDLYGHDLIDMYKTAVELDNKDEQQRITRIINALHATLDQTHHEKIIEIFKIDDWFEFYEKFQTKTRPTEL
jgi:hypothetical protein